MIPMTTSNSIRFLQRMVMMAFKSYKSLQSIVMMAPTDKMV
jgi:hypothetical protein